MSMEKTVLATAVGLAISGASLSAVADHTINLQFNPGTVGGTTTPAVGTGSWFSMKALDSGPIDGFPDTTLYTTISRNFGITIGGSAQDATGSHGFAPGCDPSSGPCTGGGGPGEAPNIDNPWSFFGATGMHRTTSPVTVKTDSGVTKILDFSGWNVTWNTIASIPMGGDTANFTGDDGEATLVCSISTCSNSSTFVLDYGGHVPVGDPSGFGGVKYGLHLEGHAVVVVTPIPAAVWLFGSGLLGLVGVARRKKKS